MEIRDGVKAIAHLGKVRIQIQIWVDYSTRGLGMKHVSNLLPKFYQGTSVRPTSLHSQVFCVPVSVVLTHHKTPSSSQTFPGVQKQIHFRTARRGHDLVHPLNSHLPIYDANKKKCCYKLINNKFFLERIFKIVVLYEEWKGAIEYLMLGKSHVRIQIHYFLKGDILKILLFAKTCKDFALM